MSVCRICLPVAVQNSSPDVRRPDELLEHRRNGRGQIHITLSVLRLHVRLDFAALRFLANVEGAAVFTNVLVDLKTERFAGAEWTTSREKRIEHTIPRPRFFEDALHAFLVRCGLPLVLHQRRVDEALVPGSRKQTFAVLVDGGRNDCFHDVRVVPNRRWRH